MVIYWVKVNRWFDILVTSKEVSVRSIEQIQQVAAEKFTTLYNEPAETACLYKIESLKYVEDLVLFKIDPMAFA